MTDRLKDKVAIVFGAGRTEQGWSNGAATAVAFAREGTKVISVDINPDAARRTADLIRHEGGGAIDVVADVTSGAQINAAVRRALEAFGRIDILHNNVGINRPGGPVDMDEAVWDSILATNVKSLFLTCKAVIPALVQSGGGSIINVSSITSVAWLGRPTIAYSSSKAAVNQFTRSIAAQHGPQNIRCNAILAGTIDTPRASSQLKTVWKADEDVRRQRARWVPLRRLGTPWEVANTAVFLASDESSYVSGAIIAVDGGLTCTAAHSAPD
jgi:NAD(P)-dependent dehydrogenase (short-subunit alcohol dehydrogenase family)